QYPHRQVMPRHQPPAQPRHPSHRLPRPQPRQHRMRLPRQLRHLDLTHRHPTVSRTWLRSPGAVPRGTPPAALRCGSVPDTRLGAARITAARRVIDPIFLDTPLYRCEALEPDLGCRVSIKLETANPVRSFKARGTEVVASLLAGTGSPAVVCASAGNLGQAL